jgi:hypothetical protein
MRAVTGSSSTPVTCDAVAQVSGHQRREQTRADAGFEDLTAAPAEPLNPDHIAARRTPA